MIFQETELGFEYKGPNHFVFFGKKNSSIENLKNFYPQFTFKALWQVHGNNLINSIADSENNQKADAQWTEEKNLALISKSADCIPVLAYCQKLNRILAIHAGWRGVQNKIIPNSLQELGSSWDLYIGPHITKNSFEIGNDCLNLLAECTQLNISDWFFDGKADLLKIVIDQIKESPASFNSVNELIFDTKTDLRFHSHRRDQNKAGRQNSFIVLI